MSNQDDNQRDDVGQYIKLDPKDAFYLQRTQVLKDLQEEMGKWSKKQFAWISIVCLIGGWIGIPLIVANIAKSQIKEVTSEHAAVVERAEEKLRTVVTQARDNISDVVHEAEHATTEAVNATRTATEDVEAFREVLGEIEATADRIDETLRKLSVRVTEEGDLLVKGIERNTNSLRDRLASVELRINQLLEKSDPPSAREFSTEQSRLKTQSDRVRATFRGNYTIWLDDLSRRARRNPMGQREDRREQGQNEITTKLRALGFRVAGSVRARPRDAVSGTLVRWLRRAAARSSIVVFHHPDTRVPVEILEVLSEIRGKPATLAKEEECPKQEIFIFLPTRSTE